MDCGLMPITGIPLPFMSYGSSFMVVNFVMLGMNRLGVVPQCDAQAALSERMPYAASC